MENKKNSKKTVFIAVSAVLFAVICIVLAILISKNSDKLSKLYGSYEYIDEQGQKSVITISKDSVYMSDLDYESCEEGNALLQIATENMENDEIIEDLSLEEYKEIKERRVSEITENLDFKGTFDKINSPYSALKAENDTYILLVGASENEYENIHLNLDTSKKECNLLGKKSFKYALVND